MKFIKKIPFVLLSLLVFIIGILALTLLNFVDVFSNNITNVLIYILFFALLFLNNWNYAKKSKKKGFVIGSLGGLSVTLVLLILKLIYHIEFAWSNLIYLLFIFGTSITGGIIGANMKKNSNIMNCTP